MSAYGMISRHLYGKTAVKYDKPRNPYYIKKYPHDPCTKYGNCSTLFSCQVELPTIQGRSLGESINWNDFGNKARGAVLKYKRLRKNYPPDEFTDESLKRFIRKPVTRDKTVEEIRQCLRPTDHSLFPHGGGMFQEDHLATIVCVDKAIQTDKRDGEVQTEPFNPPYTVKPFTAPEVLIIASLSYGKGLPAGISEIEVIERARQKRLVECQLSQLMESGTATIKDFYKVDDLERTEWAFRENEIIDLQKRRLQVMEELLVQREKNTEYLTHSRLSIIWQQKDKERDQRLRIVQYEHLRSIRRMCRMGHQAAGKRHHRDIIADYGNPASVIFVPLTRSGVFPDRRSEMYEIRNRYLRNYECLLELEQSIPPFVLNPRVSVPTKGTTTYAGFTKRKDRAVNEMAELAQYLEDKKNPQYNAPKPLRFLVKIEPDEIRPTTPSIVEPCEYGDDVEEAAKVLQQLIRGMAVHTMMYEGIMKRRDLISEIRSTHALRKAEFHLRIHERQAALKLQKQRHRLHNYESTKEEALSRLEGSSLGGMLDFLTKELIRLQEERRIHAFALLVERQRRMREAEESGWRQMEERRRREEDEIFKQVLKVHQGTVDTYLEDVIINSCEGTANQLSRFEIRILAQRINEVAYEMEARKNELQSEEICSELVHQFLIPEVQKQTTRARIIANQRKHLLAAHREIVGHSTPIIAVPPPPPALLTPQQSPQPVLPPPPAPPSLARPTIIRSVNPMSTNFPQLDSYASRFIDEMLNSLQSDLATPSSAESSISKVEESSIKIPNQDYADPAGNDIQPSCSDYENNDEHSLS